MANQVDAHTNALELVCGHFLTFRFQQWVDNVDFRLDLEGSVRNSDGNSDFEWRKHDGCHVSAARLRGAPT